MPLSLRPETGLPTQTCLSRLPTETIDVEGRHIHKRHRCSSPHSSNIFSGYSHNLCLIGINPFSGSLWSQSPVRPLRCLTKLWNAGVGLRDERRDADCMPPAHWSWVKMPQPCSKLSYVNFEQVGPYREIPAIHPQRPGCLGVPGRVGSGGCWSFLAAREPLGSPSPLTEPLGVHDSWGMQPKSLLASLCCLPTGLQWLWNQTQVCVLTNLPSGAMWHLHSSFALLF